MGHAPQAGVTSLLPYTIKAAASDPCCHSRWVQVNFIAIRCSVLPIYLKSQDYGDVSAGAQQGCLTMS